MASQSLSENPLWLLFSLLSVQSSKLRERSRASELREIYVAGNLLSLLINAWELARGRLAGLAAYALAFRFINVILFALPAAFVLKLFLARWGKASVGNFEIASFFLSPTGLGAIVCVGAIVLAASYFEIAGLMRLMADRHLAWYQVWLRSAALLKALILLGASQLIITLIVAAPFIAGIWGLYKWLWEGRDLNGLIILKPPEFWTGAISAGACVAVLLVILLVIYLHWLFAVPSVLFEGKRSPGEILRTSRLRTRRLEARLALAIVSWLALRLVVSALAFALAHMLLLPLLQIEWSSLFVAATVTGMVLSFHAILGGLLDMLTNIGFSAIVLAAYQDATTGAGQGTIVDLESEMERLWGTPTDQPRTIRLTRTRVAIGTLVGLMFLAICTAGFVTSTLKIDEPVEVTAHRAGAAHAPENSVAAIQRAIEDRANWAEIDVQLTSDEAIVVMHDTDLARVGGGKATVGSVTLAEIQQLDLGSTFSPKFAGERIPTFTQVLDAARDKIRLNVELKPHSSADGQKLARRVVETIQQAGMVDQCRICSQSFESITLAKKLEPKIEVGFIVATAVGDLTRTQADFLMLSNRACTRSLVDRAHAKGLKIHAWTINDPKLVPDLVDAGVDNIITDDPAMIIRTIEELEDMHPVQRLLLRARSVLLQ